jgi:DNA-binding MarR family transcriptional regulator
MAKKNAEPPVEILGDLDPIIHAPARLMLMTYLYVVERADYVFLQRMTGLTWGNLSTHLTKLEEAGYVKLEKGFKDKKPHTMVQMTAAGRSAFTVYKDHVTGVLDELP